ncbi:hypothetical protein [Sulfitobacter sp. 1A15106]|uniref:hypothetical protein n=1 Tax=Sulfitobacter sp. 1A15106 TaxID=3368590 RepID=UPI003746D788
MTKFNNAAHTVCFLPTDKLGDAERAHLSDLVLSALADAGMFDRTTIAPTAPSAPRRRDLWVDTGSAPAVVKCFDGAGWAAASFDEVFPVTKATSSPGAPANPAPGDLWTDTATGEVLVRAHDGSSERWVNVATIGDPRCVKMGSYSSPSLLPPAGSAGKGAATYCEGMAGVGGAEGMVYCDGANWRKQTNGNIVA